MLKRPSILVGIHDETQRDVVSSRKDLHSEISGTLSIEKVPSKGLGLVWRENGTHEYNNEPKSQTSSPMAPHTILFFDDIMYEVSQREILMTRLGTLNFASFGLTSGSILKFRDPLVGLQPKERVVWDKFVEQDSNELLSYVDKNGKAGFKIIDDQMNVDDQTDIGDKADVAGGKGDSCDSHLDVHELKDTIKRHCTSLPASIFWNNTIMGRVNYLEVSKSPRKLYTDRRSVVEGVTDHEVGGVSRSTGDGKIVPPNPIPTHYKEILTAVNEHERLRNDGNIEQVSKRGEHHVAEDSDVVAGSEQDEDDDDDDFEHAQSAVFCPQIARINHSCNPNAMVVWRYDATTNKTLPAIQTIRPLSDGEEITICYVNWRSPAVERHDKLSEVYGIESLDDVDSVCQTVSKGKLEEFRKNIVSIEHSIEELEKGQYAEYVMKVMDLIQLYETTTDERYQGANHMSSDLEDCDRTSKIRPYAHFQYLDSCHLKFLKNSIWCLRKILERSDPCILVDATLQLEELCSELSVRCFIISKVRYGEHFKGTEQLRGWAINKNYR